MIGKYVWFEVVIKDGGEYVRCRCDLCGDIAAFIRRSYRSRVDGRGPGLDCHACEGLEGLKRLLLIESYASNEVFLK